MLLLPNRMHHVTSNLLCLLHSRRFMDLSTLIPLVAEAANTAVDQLIWPGGWSWTKALIFMSVMMGVALHQRNKALAEKTEEERRRHVYNVAFPQLLKLAGPFIVLTSEPVACYFRHEPFSNEFYSCDGIAIGTSPLVLMMVFGTASQIMFVGSDSVLSLANLCKLKLSCVEAYQMAAFGLCSAYALAMYALRKEREVHWDGGDGHVYTAFTAVLVTGVVAGFCKKKQPGFETFDASERRSSTSRGSEASSLATAQGRKSLDVRKSLWDGGTKGAIGNRGLKTASQRGVVEERLRGEGGGGGVGAGGGEGEGGRERGISEAAFNPGFM